MDLNTGTPIPNSGAGNSNIPNIPAQSAGIPTDVSNNNSDQSQQDGQPKFMNPLESLKKITNNNSSTSNPNTPTPQNTTSSKDPVADSPTTTSPVGNPSQVENANSQQSSPQVPTPNDSSLSGDPVADQTAIPTNNLENTVPTADPVIVSPPTDQNSLPSTPLNTDKVEMMPQQVAPLPDVVYAQPGSMQTAFVKAPYNIKIMLDLIVEKEASDLHLIVGYPPNLRIDGQLVTVGDAPLTPQMAKELVYSILPDDKKEQLEVNREVDLAYQHGDKGRFRINAYWQRGYISAAFRLIPSRVRTIEELKLPELFHNFSDMEQGLVLVTGPTGHGKSTSLAAIIQEINMNHPKHILTIEDPIEYVFSQQKAMVSQRELGDDTHSWKGALRSALREDPDVVLVGEMRDLETISAAITVAETGHLVFATLHTNSAAQTIQRIVNTYPDMQQDEIRTELADVLEAVVAQRLIPIKGGGRRAALEIMLMTPAIRNLIRENKIYQIDNIIRTSLDLGMITLERSLSELYKDGLLSQEDALRYALDPTEMARLLEELV